MRRLLSLFVAFSEPDAIGQLVVMAVAVVANATLPTWCRDILQQDLTAAAQHLTTLLAATWQSVASGTSLERLPAVISMAAASKICSMLQARTADPNFRPANYKRYGLFSRWSQMGPMLQAWKQQCHSTIRGLRMCAVCGESFLGGTSACNRLAKDLLPDSAGTNVTALSAHPHMEKVRL